MSFVIGGLALHPEIFFVLPVLMAVYMTLFLRSGMINLFAIGVFAGIAFNIKSVCIFDMAAISFFIFWSLTRANRKADFFGPAAPLFALGAGFLMPLLSAMAYFKLHGGLNEMLSAYFGSGFDYVLRHTDYIKFAHDLGRYCFSIFGALNMIIVFALFAAAGYFLGLYGKNEKIKFLIIWLLFILCGIVIHRSFWPHTFIQALPAASLLAGFCITDIFSKKKGRKTHILLYIYISFGLILLTYPNILQYRDMITIGAKNTFERDHDRVAAYLKQRLDVSEYIFVCNDMPILYFLTGVKIPTRYPFADFLKTDYGYKDIDAAGEVKKALSKMPAYIILPEGGTIFSKDIDEYLIGHINKYYFLEKELPGARIYAYIGHR